MLVLSRKKDQSILIDGQIEIQVLQIKGNTIRLGVSAPGDVRILRGELKPFGMESGTDNSDSPNLLAGTELKITRLTA